MFSKSTKDVDVLYLLPYSEKDSIHGGKIRAREIEKLIKLSGLTVRTVHLGDLRFTKEENGLVDGFPSAIVGDVGLLDKNFHFAEGESIQPKILIFEQPWSWNEVKRIKMKYPTLKVVYSSQNIEWRLKELILHRYIGRDANRIISKIRNLEIEISQNVDRVLVVSESDSEWHSTYTKSKPIVLPNGTSLKNLSDSHINIGNENYGIIVGSAHPPNIEGCLKYLADPELWLPLDTKLVVVGSLATALQEQWGQLQNRWNQSCIELIPKVPDTSLTDLLVNSKLILLPISYGGGTNLKTAEALGSCRPIVASEPAFRGYETFRNDEHVNLARNVSDFKIKCISYLLKPRIETIVRNTSKLQWSNSLLPLEKLLKEMLYV